MTEPETRSNKQAKMLRVDVRVPIEIIARLEARAGYLGVPISEVVRWMIVRDLDKSWR